MGKCYLLHLGYDGSRYKGWQKQPDQPTIQEGLYKTLEGLFPKGRIRVFAASRTDSGVHAIGQTCKLDIPCRLPAGELKELLNDHLPEDIFVFDARRIAPSFKITDYVVAKEYLYFFTAGIGSDLSFVTSFEESLDYKKMQEGAQLFKGEHDFFHYQYRSQVKGDFNRKIIEIELLEANSLFPKLPEGVMVLKVKGNGFLKQMIRLMVGALVNLGSSKITMEDLKQSLLRDGDPVGFIAPANGLILYKIDYPDWQDDKIQPVIDLQNWQNLDLPFGFFPNKTLK